MQLGEPNYDIMPCIKAAVQADKQLEMVHNWLMFFEQPEGLSDQDQASLAQYASWFFLDDSVLWKQDPQGAHKRVLYRHTQI